MKSREEQVEQAAEKFCEYTDLLLHRQKAFCCGAEWADANPLTEGRKKFSDTDVLAADLTIKLAIAVEALEYIGNSVPGPEQSFELESKRAAQNALIKIKNDNP